MDKSLIEKLPSFRNALNDSALDYFYFDESIHDSAGFILGAYIYSEFDLTPAVYEALMLVGLKPKEHEFKSSILTDGDEQRQKLRKYIKLILQHCKIGLIITPNNRRNLNNNFIRGLNYLIFNNKLNKKQHDVYIDKGINPFGLKNKSNCKFHVNQDSCIIGGIQVADLAAHTMAIMLKEELGIINKKVKAGNNSGYDPELEINIGFELWASIRYNFFNPPCPDIITIQNDPLNALALDTSKTALFVSDECSCGILKAAKKVFGTNYLGCIH